jgi:hypothetical protein
MTRICVRSGVEAGVSCIFSTLGLKVQRRGGQQVRDDEDGAHGHRTIAWLTLRRRRGDGRLGAMRRSASAAAIAVAVAIAAGAASAAGGPGGVYNDFVQNGKLGCSYSRADLQAALRSGTLNQYGDPYELARLRLAIRRQLAGGCRPGAYAQGDGTKVVGGATAQTGAGGRATPKHAKHSRTSAKQPATKPASRHSRQASVGGGGGSSLASRSLVLVGLVVALGLGGWLTRRALARD